MYLLCQTYVPLPDSVYHRVIYIWACNRRSCMRKEGSFSVVRSHLVDEDYLRAQQQKEAQKKKREEQKKASSGFGTPQGFQLGDLWGGDKSFGATTTGFGSTGFGTTSPKPNTNNNTETLAARLGKLHLKDQPSSSNSPKAAASTKPPVDTTDLPSFPGEYLYITPEDMDKNGENGDIDMSRYQEYLDQEADLLNDATLHGGDGEDGEGGTWASEQYEKQQLPRGVDKQFKKFMDRVKCEPSQCIRYEWSGSPLLYHQELEGKRQGGPCSACGGPRVYEMQLMPNVLSTLPTSEYATNQQQQSKATSSGTAASKLDSLNIGMEFGTVLIYVCKNDCHPGDTHDATFVLESAIVQYELD
ncbi:unnamed protein product [Absidia cylindrospora]